MLYNINGNKFKIVEEKDKFKLYHKAENKWSTGWTFIGIYKSIEKAKKDAKKY